MKVVRRKPRRPTGRVLAGLVLVGVLLAVSATQLRPGADVDDDPVSAAPDPDGYFATEPAGSWFGLPSDEACDRRVHRSDWEPRPSNTEANRRRPEPSEARASLLERPRGDGHTYSAWFNTWLLSRVSGQHQGTTDENIQWAACKWGISDNLLRAMAAAESTWFQGLRESDGSCVEKRGCGDTVERPDTDTRTFCDGINGFGHDYSRDYPDGVCPRTFSIIGVMAWQDPEWGEMRQNQNGTFPFSRDSTAFALDYAAAHLRGCMEGWIVWLGNRDGYRRGDVWGCVGVWYGGDWKIPAAEQYADRVKELMEERIWLQPDFARQDEGASS